MFTTGGCVRSSVSSTVPYPYCNGQLFRMWCFHCLSDLSYSKHSQGIFFYVPFSGQVSSSGTIFFTIFPQPRILIAWLISTPSSVDKEDITTFEIVKLHRYMPFSVLCHIVFLCSCVYSFYLIFQLDFFLKSESSVQLIILSPCKKSNICKKQYLLTLKIGDWIS